MTAHLAAFVGPEEGALVFTGTTGRTALRRSSFQQLAGWTHAAAEIGMPGVHFHDLRHTGNTLAADTGASTKNLMARMGHDDEKAALRYQHRSKEADQAIADSLNKVLGSGSGDQLLAALELSGKEAGDMVDQAAQRRRELAEKLVAVLDKFGDDDGESGVLARV